MNHKPFRQVGLRIGLMFGLFVVLCLVAYLLGVPKPWVWSLMLVMLAWQTVFRHLL